ncbi:hypothetical protein LTR62_007703 [Meristemomyces frigidus]|uniref:Uncharacterized protein n=1 Tax=Meristemomyces frigidus TaxID=1508187 RepID=A0AAN7YDB5_9PEZI|nr:hypothetical protein LTR62_007703 [Meristemomyces frigidus]
MSSRCPFLHLPVELRLQIYSYVLLDNSRITIGSAELVGSHPGIIHRIYGDKRTPYAGLPLHHEPVVEAGYNASLLSTTKRPVIPLSSTPSSPNESHAYPGTSHTALQLLNKQVHNELKSHFKSAQGRTTSLFLSYPHGLHVCRTLTPNLLRQARSIHIAGQYVPRAFSPARAACLGPSVPLPELETKYNGDIPPPSTAQLTELIASCFGPQAKHPLQKLELRIYYPGYDSYSTVWGDDSSPIVVALRNIYCGEVGIEVWRGSSSGTGVYLTARPAKDGERRRTVSTVWRKLEEGRRGEPECGSWVVDPKWPAWEDECAAFGAAGATMSDLAMG